MSYNTLNPSFNTNNPLTLTQNFQNQFNPQPQQEIPQQSHQPKSKLFTNNQQDIPLQSESDGIEKQAEQQRPEDEQNFNHQNSMQMSSRIQNILRNTNFTPFNNQKTVSCHCKKSKCLKMYCQCYAKGNKCRDTCKCIGCQNTKNCLQDKKPQNLNEEDVSKSDDSNKKSVKLKQRACNCKKSFCLKKYCECFNSNQACGDSCKCEQCKNNGENNHLKEQKNLGVSSGLESVFYNVSINRQVSQGQSQVNGGCDKKQQEVSVKRRQKLDEDQIETKISQILKLVPQQNYQTMLDFLAYYLS